MSEANDFVVISTQRSGSTWFIDLFRNCEDTEGHQELFYRYPRMKPPTSGFNEYGRYCELNPAGIAGYRPYSVWKYLKNLYIRPGTVGFKLQYSHYKRYPEILAYLFFNKIKVIHLVRENSLDLVISQTLAQQTGASHITSSESTRERSIKLDADETVRRIKLIEKKKKLTRRILKTLFPSHLEINYEQLLEGVQSFDQVIEYLQLRKIDHGFKSGLVKRQTTDVRMLISNFDDIESRLNDAGLNYLL